MVNMDLSVFGFISSYHESLNNPNKLSDLKTDSLKRSQKHGQKTRMNFQPITG